MPKNKTNSIVEKVFSQIPADKKDTENSKLFLEELIAEENKIKDDFRLFKMNWAKNNSSYARTIRDSLERAQRYRCGASGELGENAFGEYANKLLNISRDVCSVFVNFLEDNKNKVKIKHKKVLDPFIEKTTLAKNLSKEISSNINAIQQYNSTLYPSLFASEKRMVKTKINDCFDKLYPLIYCAFGETAVMSGISETELPEWNEPALPTPQNITPQPSNLIAGE